MTATIRDDHGTAGVEAAIAVVALLLVMWFVVGALRVTNTGGDVDAAARAGARAAATAYEQGGASSAAGAVVADMLSNRGVACQQLSVGVSGDLAPGGVVAVDVSCTVSLSDVVLAGFGSRTMTGRGVEHVDIVRGGGR